MKESEWALDDEDAQFLQCWEDEMEALEAIFGNLFSKESESLIRISLHEEDSGCIWVKKEEVWGLSCHG